MPFVAARGIPVTRKQTRRSEGVWVEEDLSVPDWPEVFVIGDLIAKNQNNRPLRGVAPPCRAGATPRKTPATKATLLGDRSRLSFRSSKQSGRHSMIR